jgi:catechol 2,3-dioxygenase-like lactoylglutathione lyase family enzyme
MTERGRDVAHIGHAELLTPAPEASLEYFTALLGLTVAAEGAGSWYLRGYGDYEPYSLKLTSSDHAGLGHLAVRAWSPRRSHAGWRGSRRRSRSSGTTTDPKTGPGSRPPFGGTRSSTCGTIWAAPRDCTTWRSGSAGDARSRMRRFDVITGNVAPARYHVPIISGAGRKGAGGDGGAGVPIRARPDPGSRADAAVARGRGAVRVELGPGQVPGAARGRGEVALGGRAAQAVECGEEGRPGPCLVVGELQVRLPGGVSATSTGRCATTSSRGRASARGGGSGSRGSRSAGSAGTRSGSTGRSGAAAAP